MSLRLHDSVLTGCRAAGARALHEQVAERGEDGSLDERERNLGPANGGPCGRALAGVALRELAGIVGCLIALKAVEPGERHVGHGAAIGAAPAGDALARSQVGALGVDAYRAAVLAAVATARTAFAAAVEKRDRQHRQQREYGAEGAEELAEETLDKGHPNHDRAKCGKGRGRDALERARGDAGEGDPGARARDLGPDTHHTEGEDAHEDGVLDKLERVLHARGEPVRALALEAKCPAQRGCKCVDDIAERTEGAGKAAEETAEHAGEGQEGQKQG